MLNLTRPLEVDIYIHRGEDYALPIFIGDSQDAPLDLTGHDFYLKLVDSHAEGATVLCTLSGAEITNEGVTGWVTPLFPRAKTALIAESRTGDYWWELRSQDADGYIEVVGEGRAYVWPDIAGGAV